MVIRFALMIIPLKIVRVATAHGTRIIQANVGNMMLSGLSLGVLMIPLLLSPLQNSVVPARVCLKDQL